PLGLSLERDERHHPLVHLFPPEGKKFLVPARRTSVGNGDRDHARLAQLKTRLFAEVKILTVKDILAEATSDLGTDFIATSSDMGSYGGAQAFGADSMAAKRLHGGVDHPRGEASPAGMESADDGTVLLPKKDRQTVGG